LRRRTLRYQVEQPHTAQLDSTKEYAHDVSMDVVDPTPTRSFGASCQGGSSNEVKIR
jgi:hypothetical protein